MLKGILTRFIVERHNDIENVSYPDQALVWRTGVVLSKANNRAEIIENQNDREIQIRVSGPRPRDLLVTIHDEFEKIHDSFGEQLKYDILVPCNCTECKAKPKPSTFALDLLYRRLDKGSYKIECHESGEDVQVQSLIDIYPSSKEPLNPEEEEEDNRFLFSNQVMSNLEELEKSGIEITKFEVKDKSLTEIIAERPEILKKLKRFVGYD
jgi:internalin A